MIASSTPAPVVVQGLLGQYFVNFGSSVAGHAIVVSGAYRDGDSGLRGTAIATICGAGSSGTPPPDTSTCASNNNTSTVYVITSNPTNSLPANHAFYVAVL